VSDGIVKPDPDKVVAIKNYNIPKTIKELRSFLGLVNYCREYIPNFANLASPLNSLLKGESKKSIKKIAWNQNIENSFNQIKTIIANKVYRAQPNLKNKFILTTDASNEAIGAVLAQENRDGKREMIYAFIRKLDDTQRRYSVTDKELLALVKGIEHFRHFLLGTEFVVETDHKALQYLWSNKDINTRLFRWSLKLQEYSFVPRYIRGESNPADGLSRSENIINVLNFDDKSKKEILEEYHTTLGHGSPQNMKFSLSEKYYWPRMYKDIVNCV
jgi:hypothetical protein